MARVLVTGANRGIGLELVQQLHQRGDEVIAVCRNSTPALQQAGVRVIEGVDVSSEASVQALVQQLKGSDLDWLVNNAGILHPDTLDTLDFEAIEKQFRVNSIGPLRITAALRPMLRNGSKVFVISSRVGSITDNSSGRNYGYRMSKAAVNIAVKSLSIDLREQGVSVFALHPGYVATDMTRHQGPTQAADSVTGLLERMEALGPTDSGSFWHAEGYALPW